jgi:hypothetical protein
MNRPCLSNLDRFYEVLEQLSRSTDGPRKLTDSRRRNGCPDRGVYFFFEQGENRPQTSKPRVVRVGTHGLKIGSKSTLHGRLSQHRGTDSGGGNHRGSIFRLHVGKALLRRSTTSIQCDTWGKGSSASSEIRQIEATIEQAVSQYMNNLAVLCLCVPDESGPQSDRGYIERNAIGLLAGREPPSSDWLGLHSGNENIVRSHLWNVNHINHAPEPDFLDRLQRFVDKSPN